VGRGFLHLAFEVGGPFAAGTHWNVGIDVDGDDRFDVVLGFDSELRPWVGRVLKPFAETDFHPFLCASLGVRGASAELFVPLAALGVRGPVRLFPYTVSGEPLGRVDGIGWIKVDLGSR
jgi:hypothetical protein